MQSKWVQEEYSHFHWLLTHFIRKKDHMKTRAVTAQLMNATKIVAKIPPLAAIYRVCTSWFVAELGGIPPQRHTFSLQGSIMIFLHICVNIGASQLCVNRSARTADQRFCCCFIGCTLHFNEILYIKPSYVTAQPSFCRKWSEKAYARFCRDAAQ